MDLKNPLVDVRAWWSSHKSGVLTVAIAVLAAYAVMKLGTEFYRLLFDDSRMGALDLTHRYREVHRWFAHLPVYFESKFATYPPMSYLFFWLAMGWLSLDACRWVWAGASLVSLFWLGSWAVRQSNASTGLERIFAAMLPISMTATGVAIGNGQITQFLLPALAIAILLILRKQELTWRSELAVVALMLVALVHPTVASPFFLIVLIAAPRIRPALLIGLGYLLLSHLAASFQAEELPALANSWVGNVRTGVEVSGYVDLHIAMHYAGWGRWQYPASILTIAGFAVWVFLHRNLEPWLMLGVTAIVARLWTYHGLYDDMLMIFPIITLFRIAKGPSQRNADVIAGLLLGLNVLVMILPARMHFVWPSPWPEWFAWAHVAAWIPTLAFLLMQAGSARSREVRPQGLASA